MKGREERYTYERKRGGIYLCKGERRDISMKGREDRYIYVRERGEIYL